MICTTCPRNCNYDRSALSGYCGAKDEMLIAKTMLHTWEEPVISGTGGQGSGAIFFSNCSLKCIYCQNYEISRNGKGKPVTVEGLAEIMKELEKRGAVNINLVTPTQYTTQIIEALKLYRPNIPIVWNTSGYETVQNIRRLADYVDIYLADLKYFSPVLSESYSGAKNYFEYASKAVLAMRKNQPNDIFSKGIMQKGMIVRHLVLPKSYQDSILVLNWIKENLGTNTYISLMNQYTPTPMVLNHPILKNRTRPLEYKVVVEHAVNLGFCNGFTQEATSQTLAYTPEF